MLDTSFKTNIDRLNLMLLLSSSPFPDIITPWISFSSFIKKSRPSGFKNSSSAAMTMTFERAKEYDTFVSW
uniref:Uncharacterized protein n=1 Tax=Tetranychus urticae TaxID=32264 RepID=T1KX95_TETUR